MVPGPPRRRRQALSSSKIDSRYEENQEKARLCTPSFESPKINSFFRKSSTMAPTIDEAIGKPPNQPDRTICRSQQQRPGVRRDRSSVKPRYNRAAFHSCKFEQFCVTLCRHRGAPRGENNAPSGIGLMSYKSICVPLLRWRTGALPRASKCCAASGLATVSGDAKAARQQS